MLTYSTILIHLTILPSFNSLFVNFNSDIFGKIRKNFMTYSLLCL